MLTPSGAMDKKLHVLILEDVLTDAELAERELRKAYTDFSSKRVETKESFLKELESFGPDLILADYTLPSFDGLSALALAQEKCPDVPFIFVSGTLGEELAIETLKSGATDYVLKERLSRLVPAVRRALREAEERTARRRAEETVHSLLRISEKLNSTLDVDRLMDALVQEVIKLIDAESGCAGLRTAEGMVCHKYFQKSQILPLEYCWPPGHGLPGWLIVHKVPYITNNALNDEQTSHELYVKFGVRSAISTPILGAQGEVIAFFEVHNKKDASGFIWSDQEKVAAVSQAASIAFQNALAYRKVRHAEEAANALAQELLAHRDRLRALTIGILGVREEEAKRIARALHDEAGQLLASVHIALEEATRQLPPPAGERLQGVRRLLDQIDEQLRRLSHELRPTILDNLGLLPALQFLAQGISTRAQVPITVEGSAGGRLPPAIETALYRVVQEALTNVTKHAQARHVRVQLQREAQMIRCVIRDDGIGFDVPAILARRGKASLGLLGMRERLDTLGGTLWITSAPGQGTELVITIPVEM